MYNHRHNILGRLHWLLTRCLNWVVAHQYQMDGFKLNETKQTQLAYWFTNDVKYKFSLHQVLCRWDRLLLLAMCQVQWGPSSLSERFLCRNSLSLWLIFRSCHEFSQGLKNILAILLLIIYTDILKVTDCCSVKYFSCNYAKLVFFKEDIIVELFYCVCCYICILISLSY